MNFSIQSYYNVENCRMSFQFYLPVQYLPAGLSLIVVLSILKKLIEFEFYLDSAHTYYGHLG